MLNAARLAPPKRLDLVIDGWARIPDAHLVVAGDGPDRAALQDRAEGCGAAGRITFLGDRDDVGRLLAAADLLVLSSDREGPADGGAGGTGGRRARGRQRRRRPARAGPGSVELVGPAMLSRSPTPSAACSPTRVAAGGWRPSVGHVERRYSSSRMADAYRSLYRSAVGGRELV